MWYPVVRQTRVRKTKEFTWEFTSYKPHTKFDLCDPIQYLLLCKNSRLNLTFWWACWNGNRGQKLPAKHGRLGPRVFWFFCLLGSWCWATWCHEFKWARCRFFSWPTNKLTGIWANYYRSWHFSKTNALICMIEGNGCCFINEKWFLVVIHSSKERCEQQFADYDAIWWNFHSVDCREGLMKRICLFVCVCVCGRSKEHWELILPEKSFPVIFRGVESV